MRKQLKLGNVHSKKTLRGGATDASRQRPAGVRLRKQDTGQPGPALCEGQADSWRAGLRSLKGSTHVIRKGGRSLHTLLLTLERKPSPCNIFRWGSQGSNDSGSDQTAHQGVFPQVGRPENYFGSGPRSREGNSGLTPENSHVRKHRLLKSLLTWSESSVTRSPSLVIPSSFRSFRWGQRARQKALAMCSVSRLWSAGSLRQLCWSSFSRKNTCSPNERLQPWAPRCGEKRAHQLSVHEHPDPLRCARRPHRQGTSESLGQEQGTDIWHLRSDASLCIYTVAGPNCLSPRKPCQGPNGTRTILLRTRKGLQFALCTSKRLIPICGWFS